MNFRKPEKITPELGVPLLRKAFVKPLFYLFFIYNLTMLQPGWQKARDLTLFQNLASPNKILAKVSSHF